MASTLSHHDYSVAWICALPLEMAAAKAMLDEIHPHLSQSPSDHNTYTLGRLSSHNVAIACLPSNVYGTISAATVLSQMLATFPSLRFGLMVGIGGGVPSESADIRLGDVVVSMPTANSGGVIQYDYGKTIADGKFQHTGSLNKPPQALLTAVSQMRSNFMMGERPLNQMISETMERYEQMREQFSRPGKDLLFESDYNHQSSSSDCSKCDRSQLVNRMERKTDEPYIHYGLIASGDNVMKDSKTRDALAQELDILCFEMEAAALMDQLPCLVVRGICDYCDSHKHKEWQGFAALTAAAYAKTLLDVVPVYQSTRNNGNHKQTEHYWMVPFQRNPRFVGRQDEITKLEELLTQQNGRKIAISGLGGMGKTQIVLELAYRVRQKDDCSIFWIPCTSYDSVEQGYMSIAQMVGIADIRPADVKEQVNSYLQQKDAGKWMVIFDNADDIDMWMTGKDSDTTQALKKFIPRSEQGHVIFTTRNRKLAVKLASTNVISVGETDKKTAEAILRKSLIQQDQMNDGDITSLLERLTFLPLAITQAAAYINENSIGLSDYLTLLQEQEPDVVELLSEDFEDEGRYDETQNPVATTWLVSFQQIQQLDPLAAEYLSLMACFDPCGTPQSLLPKAPSQNKRINALGLLNAYSFIDISPQAQDDLLSLHSLVHLATRNWLVKNNSLSEWTCKAADQLDKHFPSRNHQNRKLWRQYMPHALFIMEKTEFHDQKVRYEDLLDAVAECLFSDGRYNEAEVWLLETVERRRKTKGSRHISTLDSVNDLASVYRRQGRWSEAEAYQTEVANAREEISGRKHHSTLIAFGNLASVYWHRGRWEEAEKLETWVLQTSQEVLGPDHEDTLTSMNNLSMIFRFQGQDHRAQELEEKLLQTKRRVLGPDHPDTVTSMCNLACIYDSLGRVDEAEELQLQALNSSNQILGPLHPKTLTAVSILASIYKAQGRLEEARTLNVQVLEGRKQVLGPTHPKTLSKMHDLAISLFSLGETDEALLLIADCAKLCKEHLGPEDRETVLVTNRLHKWQQRLDSGLSE